VNGAIWMAATSPERHAPTMIGVELVLRNTSTFASPPSANRK
jgi:hypothetical protein